MAQTCHCHLCSNGRVWLKYHFTEALSWMAFESIFSLDLWDALQKTNNEVWLLSGAEGHQLMQTYTVHYILMSTTLRQDYCASLSRAKHLLPLNRKAIEISPRRMTVTCCIMHFWHFTLYSPEKNSRKWHCSGFLSGAALSGLDACKQRKAC